MAWHFSSTETPFLCGFTGIYCQSSILFIKMNQNFFILVLCLLLLAGTSLVKVSKWGDFVHPFSYTEPLHDLSAMIHSSSDHASVWSAFISQPFQSYTDHTHLVAVLITRYSCVGYGNPHKLCSNSACTQLMQLMYFRIKKKLVCFVNCWVVLSQYLLIS